ncbi:hypothetical protein [Lederbergia citri]|uniref:Uncharacterized protein n=1 Tax=Lederbergia citri TaxID=2833580 RepID=A0A942THD0_9BACI|nr:hypothetical protein [Lederbergia citri]MBS4197665.1 hypothetical protein [Lederbergia citri]
MTSFISNLDNLQKKYMIFSKKKLVQKLILAEEYITESNTMVTNYFGIIFRSKKEEQKTNELVVEPIQKMHV